MTKTAQDRRDDAPPAKATVDETRSDLRPTTAHRDYEELEGGVGRAVYFRPQRLGLDDLAPILLRVEIVTQLGERVACALSNVSQNGVALSMPHGEAVIEPGTVLELVMRFGGHHTYTGKVRVEWAKPEPDALLVGAAFLDALLDLDEVIQLRDVLHKMRITRTSRRAWRVAEHDRFKAAIGEFALRLEDEVEHLAEVERSLPPAVFYSPRDSAARKELVAHVHEDFVPTCVRYSEELDAAMRLAGPREHEALREYSQRHLNRYLMQAPWMRRAFEKPLGYAGDFEVMNYVYERGLEGSNLFAKAIHLAFLEVRAADAVRARKDLVKRELSAKLAEAEAEGRTARVLSIAAGPAQELYELFSEGSVRGKVHVTLFDQDQGALTYAHRRLGMLAQTQRRDSVDIVYLRDSIKRLLVDPEIFSDHGTFDAIVCAGFFDYLRIHSAVRATRTFYRYLRPGGTAYIGNMAPENPSRWLMEYHLDWSLIHRSRDEMTAFAREAAPDAKIEIIEERTGINPFLAIERPR